MEETYSGLSSLSTNLDIAHRSVAIGETALRHVTSELSLDTETILATISSSAPLAFLGQMPDETGKYVTSGVSTLDRVRARYNAMHASFEVLAWEPMISIRRDWYVFEEGITTHRDVGTREVTYAHGAVIFPADRNVIHGELGWRASPESRVPDPWSAGMLKVKPSVRTGNVATHARLLHGFRNSDVESICAELEHDVVMGVRDYATGGPFAAVESRESAARFLRSFFDAFEINDVSVVNCFAANWYVFSELIWTITSRDGQETMLFCTATIYPIIESGRIAAVLGYGTSPEPIPD